MPSRKNAQETQPKGGGARRPDHLKGGAPKRASIFCSGFILRFLGIFAVNRLFRSGFNALFWFDPVRFGPSGVSGILPEAGIRVQRRACKRREIGLFWFVSPGFPAPLPGMAGVSPAASRVSRESSIARLHLSPTTVSEIRKGQAGRRALPGNSCRASCQFVVLL